MNNQLIIYSQLNNIQFNKKKIELFNIYNLNIYDTYILIILYNVYIYYYLCCMIMIL